MAFHQHTQSERASFSKQRIAKILGKEMGSLTEADIARVRGTKKPPGERGRLTEADIARTKRGVKSINDLRRIRKQKFGE